ncbi:MAG: site-specific integrase [Janthinobacterium lividum]
MAGKPVSARVSEVALTVGEADAVRVYGLAEKSEATRHGYRSDFGGFSRWCLAHGVDPLPASAGTVAAFLASEATVGAKASTLTRKTSAIRYAHRLAGHPSPTDIEQVRAILRGIRNTHGAAPHQKAPATADRIKAMLEHVPETLKGKRDRALLALGMAGAFRRSELVALQVADLERVPDGLRVTIRKSKTDQEGIGDVIAILRGSRLRPMRAVVEWLDAACITSGPVFRAINRHGQVSTSGLTPQTVALVVKHYANGAGLDPDEFAGHSLRAGFLTSAAEAGADVLRMMEVSRHKRVETVRGYVRRANLFRGHAGAGFL